MATRIRLRRMGAKKRPFYRVVVADQRAPRDGRFIENIGKYHPLEDPSLIEIDEERALHWLRVGAQPSSQVRNLMVKIGIWDRFVEERPSAADLVRKRTEKPAGDRLSKKAAAKAAAEAKAPPEAPAAPVEVPVAIEAPPEVETPEVEVPAVPEAPEVEASAVVEAPEPEILEAPEVEAPEEPAQVVEDAPVDVVNAPVVEETTEA
jgi:small subunit ribosomal protein S16